MAASMCSPRRRGEVGCSRTRISVSNPVARIASMACFRTGSIGASSDASDEGRMNGTSRPSALAQVAIRSSSVLTIVRVRRVLSFTASAVYASSGRPQMGFRFFVGIPLEPPRAGITPRTFINRTSASALAAACPRESLRSARRLRRRRTDGSTDSDRGRAAVFAMLQALARFVSLRRLGGSCFHGGYLSCQVPGGYDASIAIGVEAIQKGDYGRGHESGV